MGTSVEGEQMSNTPRTDAAEVTMLRLDGDADVVVAAFFARQLERELLAARSATAETAIGHARYEYLRTLNPRKFAALYNEALMGVHQFDDLVDRYRMKGEKP